MSRTYRHRKERKDNRATIRYSSHYFRWRTKAFRSTYNRSTGDWKDDLVKLMETDCMYRLGSAKKNTKWQTRKRRRADQKMDLHRMIRHDEDDIPDRERFYKGFIWNWD